MSQASQPGRTVPGNLLPLIAQVIGGLAVAIDPAAGGPSLPDPCGLACIVPRRAAKRFLEPSIEAAEVNPQHPAQGQDAELGLMRPDECRRHWA